MVIFFVPLVPILIAVFLIGSSVASELQQRLDNILVVLTIIIIIAYLIIAISNLVNKYLSVTRKVISSISCVVGAIISRVAVKMFIEELASIKSDVFMLIEFAFVAVVGGCICLLVVSGIMYFCYCVVGQND